MVKERVLLILVLMMFLVAGFFIWQEVKAQGADWLPIKHVRIEGAFQYIAKDKVKQVLKGQLVNGLYNADIQLIQRSVKQLPWVKRVRVKRVWPDAINIKIDEQVPVVRWGSNGLLNKKGEFFSPDNMSVFESLPLLMGPRGNEKKLLEVMKGLMISLQDRGMQLAEFHVNERRTWRLKLRSEMDLILGRNEPLQKFQLFLKTFELIGKEQEKQVAVVDLRYPNGYALTWKQGEKQINWKEVAALNKT